VHPSAKHSLSSLPLQLLNNCQLHGAIAIAMDVAVALALFNAHQLFICPFIASPGR